MTKVCGDTLTRKGLYCLARAQGNGRFLSWIFAAVQHMDDRRRGIV